MYKISVILFKRPLSSQIFNKKEPFMIPKETKEIIFGSLLGDQHARRRHINTSLHFKQGQLHSEYVNHLYDIF